MNFLKDGGPTKTATPKLHQHRKYTENIRECLAAVKFDVPQHLPWHTLIVCNACGNPCEPAGEVYITAKGALILDYQRARHIEVCR